jgi:hypothetical protein
MNRVASCVLVVAVAFLAASLFGQDAGKQAPKGPTKKQGTGGFRKLAPGVVITISPESQKEETFSEHDLVRLLDKDPKFGERVNTKNEPIVTNLAKKVRIAHDIWAFELNFKPMRMLDVDVPRPGAKFDRKKIWYMVYFVRNVSNKPVKFVPRFLLITDEKVKLPNGEETAKTYADRLIPVAADPIRRREDPRRKFLDGVEISKNEIPPSTATEDNSVWGVVTWEDVDPKVDYFSVYIQGLTNAYKIETITEKDEEGQDKKRWTYLRKTLELNFWRPGDEFFETDREIRFGQPNNVEYRWVYK